MWQGLQWRSRRRIPATAVQEHRLHCQGKQHHVQNALYNNYCMVQLTALPISYLFFSSFNVLICRQSKFHFHFHLLHAGATFLLSTLSPASPTLLPHLHPSLLSHHIFFSRIPLLPPKILFLLIFLRIFISFE